MPFQKGESGNPAGRPRGARNRATILWQTLAEEAGEALARKAIDLAKDGHVGALRICLDRLAPARKAEPVAFELGRRSTSPPTAPRRQPRCWRQSQPATSRRPRPSMSPG
jgi:hypothetical protein